MKPYQIGIAYQELGLGCTRKGRIYNTQKLTVDAQRDWIKYFTAQILLADCRIAFSTYNDNVALLTYKYIPETQGWRLIDRYDEDDIMATFFRAYLDRDLVPEGRASASVSQAALTLSVEGRCA